MITVDFHKLDEIDDTQLKFVVMSSRYKGKWIFVKNKKKNTYEIPGGTIEEGEKVIVAANRELYEETGAIDFDLEPILIYSVKREEGSISYGKLYFAKINELGPIPEYEIDERIFSYELPGRLTYPIIQRILHKEVLKYIN